MGQQYSSLVFLLASGACSIASHLCKCPAPHFQRHSAKCNGADRWDSSVSHLCFGASHQVLAALLPICANAPPLIFSSTMLAVRTHMGYLMNVSFASAACSTAGSAYLAQGLACADLTLASDYCSYHSKPESVFCLIVFSGWA